MHLQQDLYRKFNYFNAFKYKHSPHLFNGVNLVKINLLFFFVGDALYKICSTYNFAFQRYPSLIKVGYLLLYFIIIFRNCSILSKYRSVIRYIAILFLVFIFGQGILFINQANFDFVGNLQYFLRYIYVFPTFIVIRNYNFSLEELSRCLSFFLFLFGINALLMVFGYVLNSELLSTYNLSRFGFNGLYARSSQVSYFFVLTSLFFLYKWLRVGIETSKWSLVVTVIVSLLAGTKSIYFFNILLGCFILIRFQLYKQILLFVSIIIGLVIAFFSLWRVGFFDLWLDIAQKSSILDSFTSFRSTLFVNGFWFFIEENWTFFNYFFGGADFGSLRRTEMLIPDLYLMFGIFGFVIFYKFYQTFVFDFPFKDKIVQFSIFSVLLIGLLSGNLLHNANIPILVILITNYFYVYERAIINEYR